MKQIDAKYFLELSGPDMGVSSITMLCSCIGLKNNGSFGNGHPADPSDFGRCYRLLERNPELKANIGRLKKFKGWQPLIENWDELVRLWEEESPSGRCPKLYALMNPRR